MYERLKPPIEGDTEVLSIEMSFAIPVYITKDQRQRLSDLFTVMEGKP